MRKPEIGKSKIERRTSGAKAPFLFGLYVAAEAAAHKPKSANESWVERNSALRSFTARLDAFAQKRTRKKKRRLASFRMTGLGGRVGCVEVDESGEKQNEVWVGFCGHGAQRAAPLHILGGRYLLRFS